MSYQARITKPLFQVTGRNGACGKMKRTGDAFGNCNCGTMDSKSCPSAPNPCNQTTAADGLGPVSTTTGASNVSNVIRGRHNRRYRSPARQSDSSREATASSASISIEQDAH